MNYMIFLFSTMLFVFFGYISYIWYKYGVLPSISESYYRLPTKINILFTLFCWGFAFPAMIMGNELTDNFLMFFATGGIMFVGASAAFKQKLTNTVHMVGAVIGVVFSQLSIAFDFNMYYLNLLFIASAGIIFLTKSKNSTWWIEIVAFIILCWSIGTKVLEYLQ